ncbi:MAG TPA: signal peptidase II [Acidimicrobiales bacterium]|nr:signal peptidase II [Acidimicrobiales bacterium]
MTAPRRLPLVAGTAAAVVVLDQLTKEWALRALVDGPVHLFWTLRLNLSINSGVAFGLGRGSGPIIVVLGVLVLAVILVATRKAELTTWTGAAAGLVVGGAVGNLVDRVFRGHGGVVDFIDFQWWPIFNVADAAISVGAVLLILKAKDEPA